MIKRLGWLEFIFLIASLCFVAGAFYPIVLYYQGRWDVELGTNDPTSMALNGMIYAVAGTLLLVRPPFHRILRAAPAILLLVAACTVSAIFSLDPATSLRRVFALGGTVILAYYMMARLRFSEFIDLLAIVSRIIIVGSLVLYLIDPYAAKMDSVLDDASHIGNWRGVTDGKNGLGAVCSFALLVFYYLGVHRRKNMILNGVFAVIAGALIVLSASATSAVVTIGVLATAIVIFSLQRLTPRFFYQSVVVSLLVIVLVGWFLWGPLLDLVGRDPTLTGRTEIWGLVLDAAARRPLLGYGYGVFWEPTNPQAAYIWYAKDWQFGHAHNGWIETFVEIGAIGTAIVLYFTAQAVVRCLMFLREARLANVGFMLILLIDELMSNITESGLTRYSDFGFVMLLCVAIALARYASLDRSQLPAESPMPALASG
jgi:exopolysaccharide production protein ExoQ